MKYLLKNGTVVSGEKSEMLDVLVDGEFMKDKKNISLQFRGSENQRILDVPLSLKEKCGIILHA